MEVVGEVFRGIRFQVRDSDDLVVDVHHDQGDGPWVVATGADVHLKRWRGRESGSERRGVRSVLRIHGVRGQW